MAGLEPELGARLVDDTAGGEAVPLLGFALRQLADSLGAAITRRCAEWGLHMNIVQLPGLAARSASPHP